MDDREEFARQEEAKKEQETLTGTADSDGTKFLITNTEKKSWSGCYFKLNGKYTYPDPQKSRLPIDAGETVTIRPGEFTLSDGTRFNILTIKPQSLSAYCSDNKSQYWVWNR